MQLIESNSMDARTSHGVRTFTLTPAVSRGFHFVRFMLLAACAGFWLYWIAGSVLIIAANVSSVFAWLFMVACLGAVSFLCAWYLKPLIRPVRLERITLAENTLSYEPGNLTSFYVRFGAFMLFFVPASFRGSRLRGRIEIPKSDVKFVLTDDEWRHGGRRLILHWNGREMEIASLLADDMRVTLYGKIREWINS